MIGRGLGLLTVVALAVLASACSEAGRVTASAAEVAERKVRVVTTTNLITDLARNVGGNRVDVTGLMGPGVDPHLYKATAGDVRHLVEADLILYGGLELEGKMEDVFVRLGRHRPTVAVTGRMPRDRLRAEPGFADRYDPHVWFDVDLWRYAVDATRDALIEVDPQHREIYERNAAAYRGKLSRLDREVRRAITTIPPERRVLITSHDAFRYFGERYGVDVVAIQGTSTATEATTADVERVAEVIAERDIGAVFVESSVPRQTIDAVLASARQRGHAARIGAELFADAAGEEGTPEGTYVGMIRHNVRALVEGLR
jgi:manganese/zinc/iron transport system substrate-binding protein